jgi:GntR family transcriptional regulator, galactonate operon transcriptional repressor
VSHFAAEATFRAQSGASEFPVSSTTPGDPDVPAEWPVWDRPLRRLASEVISDLVQRIVSGTVAPGANLPVEPELCRVYAVSRPTIREAVKSLEAMRLVEAKQGSGTRVRPRGEWNLIDPLVFSMLAARGDDLKMLDELTRLRGSIEGPVAGLAAVRAQDADLERLRRFVDDMDNSLDDPPTYLGLDMAYHRAIMDVAGSQLTWCLVYNLGQAAFQVKDYLRIPDRAECEHSNAGHRRILDGITRSDARAADDAMQEHINSAWQYRRPHRDASQPQ